MIGKNSKQSGLVLLLPLLAGACGQQAGGTKGPGAPSPAVSPAAASSSPEAAAAMNAKAPRPLPVRYSDVTEAAGIRFRHENGASGKKYLPETMGAGVAWLDYDGDGRLDLYLVNSRPWPGQEKSALPTAALYRNLGNGKFEDVTRAAGLAVPLYGMGVAVADHDNDGDPDLFQTCLGQDHLFRNDGGRFTDVTVAAGMQDDDFGSSAVWFDYDRDGNLDSVVGNYVKWSVEKDIHCTLDGKGKSYCTPESYEGASPRLWRNLGGGKFGDVTAAAGLSKPSAKTLGVVAVDHDQDGWPDLVMANDTQPNYLFRNRGDGSFSEEGVASGIAFNENGVARGAMGIDAGDYDGSGRPSLLIGNFSNEVKSLYHNEGHGLFVDAAPASNIGEASLLSLTFGCFFFDYDRDGFLDVFLANGHVEEEIEKVQSQVTWAQPPHLFRNLGGSKFAEVTKEVSEGLARPVVARGAAHADFDGDGDLDLVLTVNGGPARLFRNDGGNANHWVSVRTRGTKANRDGIGAVLTLVAGGRAQTGYVKAGSSYCSQSELAVSFGIGAADRVERIEIAWPGGGTDRFLTVPIDRHLVATEGGEMKEVAAAPSR